MKQFKQPNNNTGTARLLLERQEIGLTGVRNARDLGGCINADGKAVKYGRLIRAGQLNALTAEDKRILTDKLNTAAIIDFRTPREIELAPDMAVAGARYVCLPLLDDEENDSKQALMPPESTTELYSRIMFGKASKEAFGSFFTQLLEAEAKRAIVFHSVNGRDRTGVAAALLLTALNVPEETIMEDYMLTKGVFAHSLRYVFSLTCLEYGSVGEYLKKFCGLADSDIRTLKHKFLA